ncbi:MAG: DUF3343 domain-containing protein [Bacillota bacterium]|jgi:hypothetical protein
MVGKVYCIFTFYSTHFALRLESACKKENIPGKLIPVPRSISASCGTAFRAEVENREKIEGIADQDGVEIETVVEYCMEEQKSIFDKIFKNNLR